ncbi:MAG: hypothetical protein KF872_07545 [Chitinophagales bacterium]|nr:hypothetical protein [Chitinophagales bacterium]
MAVSAKLKIDDEEFTVLRCEYGYHYDYHNDTLQPRSNGAYYPITVRVETGTSLTLTRWAIDGIQNNRPQHAKNGRVVFSRRDRDIESTLKGVHFRNAFVIDYKEFFDSSGLSPMYMDLVIVAEYMAVSDTDESTQIASREWTRPFHQNQ